MRTGEVGNRTRRAGAAALLAAATVAIGLLAAGPSAAADVDGFEGSWLEFALEAQYELGSDIAFKDAPLVGTHNSFNSTEEMGIELDLLETNQRRSIVDQLDFGVRSLELDLHRDPRTGDPDPVVCHTEPREGCEAVKGLQPFLAGIAGWLGREENSEQVVLLYLQDGLDDLEVHDNAAAIVEDELGEAIFRPEGGGCQVIDDELTRDEVREAGKQVIVVSGCGKGAAWRSFAFSWERHRESRPRGFEDFPDCGPDYRRGEYRANLVRYYEDSTRNSTPGADDGITPESAGAMARCGVDLLSFDRLEPFDGRLEGTIWSWATDEPSTGRCALLRAGDRLPFGRWTSTGCGTVSARPACREGRRWSVGPRPLNVRRGAAYCERNGAELAVPRTGYENQLLREQMEKRRTRTALLGYRLLRGEWTPLDTRGD